MTEEIRLLDAKTLEIHYYLNDGSHAIDAKAFYTCQQELVGLIEFIAKQLNVPTQIKTTAEKKEGGVIELLQLCSENISVLHLLGAYIGGLIAPGLKEVVKQRLVHWNTESMKSDEEKYLEQLRRQEEILRLETSIASLEESNKQKFSNEKTEKAIQKRRSRFYTSAKSVEVIDRIEFGLKVDASSELYAWRIGVGRNEFDNYINQSTEIEPIDDLEAQIEVVAPVLKKGNRKWKGIYEKKEISFNMLDRGFLEDVLKRLVTFSNGSTLHCVLQIEQEIDVEGEIKPTCYNVLEVTGVSINDIPQSHSPRRKKKARPLDNSPSLFPELDDQD